MLNLPIKCETRAESVGLHVRHQLRNCKTVLSHRNIMATFFIINITRRLSMSTCTML